MGIKEIPTISDQQKYPDQQSHPWSLIGSSVQCICHIYILIGCTLQRTIIEGIQFRIIFYLFLHQVMLCGSVKLPNARKKLLTHCRLNRLPKIIYWKSPILILGISGWDLAIPREKWLNYLQTVETQIRRCRMQRLICVCTVCQLPF